jgi:formylglycine-generating enzyme required for sulfatase activity
MSKIFINYRREDSSGHAGRLYDHLANRFGETNIFMDIDNMRVGLDFVEQIEQAVQACDVLIAVIGKSWLTMKDEEGVRRLDNPHDFVRLEIQAALDRSIPVVPLLVGGAGTPKASELPDALAKLARRHAMKMSDERFRADATRLIDQIGEYVTGAATKGQPTSAPKGKPRSKPKGKSASTPKSKPTLPPKGKPAIPKGMVLIPKGPFLYGEDRVHEDIPYDYYMDIYPVTNDHYKEFMLANGYDSQNYWSAEGWAWKQGIQVNQPLYWTDHQWDKADHPVVGVSYYEAEAYASWAGKRLPTEQEWEKAARGIDGRKYPWGNVFDKTKCNSERSGIGATTPVTKYTKGTSPSGCFDMAGNVWEWCASWKYQSRGRVIRGGSWGGKPGNLRTSNRSGYTADNRNVNIGFRLAQDAP